MKLKNNGFSLVEMLVVILISGLTLASLNHILLLSFRHYDHVTDDSLRHKNIDNIRVWLRDNIRLNSSNENILSNINANNLSNELGLKDKVFVNKLKLIKRNDLGFFVKVSICYDKNGNKTADKDECEDMLFFFRRNV